MTTPKATASAPPIRLGKPSLRHRLESCYTFVYPTAISNADEWNIKFEAIYNKCRGPIPGEEALSATLCKTFDMIVKLLVAPEDEEARRKASGRGASSLEN
eukprot:13215063-Ditylum_brightwellii.AAC.1